MYQQLLCSATTDKHGMVESVKSPASAVAPFYFQQATSVSTTPPSPQNLPYITEGRKGPMETFPLCLDGDTQARERKRDIPCLGKQPRPCSPAGVLTFHAARQLTSCVHADKPTPPTHPRGTHQHSTAPPRQIVRKNQRVFLKELEWSGRFCSGISDHGIEREGATPNKRIFVCCLKQPPGSDATPTIEIALTLRYRDVGQPSRQAGASLSLSPSFAASR